MHATFPAKGCNLLWHGNCNVGEVDSTPAWEVLEMTDQGQAKEKIGEFLVKIGAMKQWQVEDILKVQKSGDLRMFGEVAISLGYIDDAVLMKYVESKSKSA